MSSTMQIRALVIRQIISALDDDLKGGELLTKEVWEACETDEQVAAAKHEVGEIIEELRLRESSKQWQGLSRAELTARLVESFSTYSRDCCWTNS